MGSRGKASDSIRHGGRAGQAVSLIVPRDFTPDDVSAVGTWDIQRARSQASCPAVRLCRRSVAFNAFTINVLRSRDFLSEARATKENGLLVKHAPIGAPRDNTAVFRGHTVAGKRVGKHTSLGDLLQTHVALAVGSRSVELTYLVLRTVCVVSLGDGKAIKRLHRIEESLPIVRRQLPYLSSHVLGCATKSMRIARGGRRSN